jgi:hypothetical protein
VFDDSSMDGPGTFQVDLLMDGKGDAVSFPAVFSSGPPKMRLDNMGIYVADYVHTSGPVGPAS